MAKYEARPNNNLSSCVSINSYEQVDSITVYLVQVKIEDCCWIVRHRYSDFFELNEKLVVALGIDGYLLPPKKLFSKHSEAFLQQRKKELELYLRAILCLPTLSPLMTTFLEFHKYEIHGITQTLAEDLFLHAYTYKIVDLEHVDKANAILRWTGDQLLVCSKFFHVTPLQLHSLAERLKLPEPTCDAGDSRKDIGHILDFFSQVRHVLVCGSNKAVGTSNIVPNQLEVDLTSFKVVERLKLDGCNPSMLQGFHSLRASVKLLEVQECLTSIKELLLCDTIHWDPEQPAETSIWSTALQADFSYNQLRDIDQSIWLLPCLEKLDLSHNKIISVDNLDRLTRLTHLNLAKNCFTSVPPLHTRLGNIVSLNFAGNAVTSLLAFSKLYSLVSLDLLDNCISKVDEIAYVAGLPCIEHLILTGNPIVTVVDYRTRVLEQFNHRASELCLDQDRPSQQEMDTVAVLQAIRRAREGTPLRRLSMPGNTGSHRSRSGHNAVSPAVPQSAHQTPQHLIDFRHQVEAIRAQGGESWLRLWNHRLMMGDPPTSPESCQVANNTLEHSECPNNYKNRDQNKKNQPAFRCIVAKDFVLPPWLPDTKQSLGCFWCLVLCFPQRIKRVTFPACVSVARGTMAVAVLKSIGYGGNSPTLVPYSHIETDTLSNLVVGQHEHFVSFEARTADTIHAYTFLFSNRRINAHFVSIIQEASIHMPNHSLRIFQQETSQETSNTAETLSFSWVAVDVPIPIRSDAVTCLAIKDKTIQLLWEQVTHMTSGRHQEPPMQVIKMWDVQKDIVDCCTSFPDDAEIYSSDSKVGEEDMLQELSESLTQTLRRSGYPLTLWFRDSSFLLVRFPSPENLDEFFSAYIRLRELRNCAE